MTGTSSPGPAADASDALTPDDEAACRQAAAQLRRQHQRWVIIWLAHTARYHAYPLYTTRPVTLSAEQPAELAALMNHGEQAARRLPASPPRTTP